MTSKADSMKKELKNLVARGNHLYIAMLDEAQGLPDDFKKELKDKKITLPHFKEKYEPWFSEALAVIKQVLPDRVADFVRQYKDEKRKEIDFLTYGISDYLLGLRTTRAGGSVVVADGSAAIPKMEIQNAILEAASNRFESSLFDIREILQADIFDSELDAARELAKKGFVRGGGAIAGVVLEKHLGHICSLHSLSRERPIHQFLTIISY